MESEEITKLVDGVYKNILEKFNPGARHLITAGKGYLKALHGAASASRLFNEALAKIAMNAQQSGTGDIGAALLNVVSVYKEIQEQQMNILKAFYVDLLVPLETNLEKDTKVVQHEQKKFLQQHKVRMESYQKAMATMKKQRKKKSSPENTEKELRTLQILEDQKKKLDAFCEQSYKNAMTQERRRYGFVLERQCSIAKHWMAYHTTGRAVIDGSLDGWQEVAAAREVMPPTAYETHFTKRLERMKEEGGGQLKKSRSVDAPFGDMRSLHEPGHGNHHSSNSSHGIHSNGHRDRDRDHSHSHSNSNNNNNGHFSQNSLPRAKSDFNLTTASSNDNWDQRPVVKALYAYMPSGENQLPFEEGDRIAMVGNKAKGWQFGENLRTQMFGWFPIAYTNAEGAEKKTVERETSGGGGGGGSYENVQFQRSSGPRRYHEYGAEAEAGTEPEPEPEPALESDSTMTYRRRNNSAEESSPTRMFGDTINFRHQKKYHGGVSSGAMAPRPGPPPTLPAPVPSASRMLNTSQSFCSPNGGVPMAHERRTQKGQGPSQGQPQASHNRFLTNKKQMNALSHVAADRNGSKQPAAKTSLHSSNDSGFANEPPPQPEIDYSDEEQTSRVPIRRRADTTSHPREVASWTLNRNFRNSVDGHIDSDRMEARVSGGGGGGGGKHGMRYDSMIASDDEILQASGSGIKRTKSFWKFGRNDDIMAGMSLWQHRDLVVAPNVNELRKASGQTNADRNEDDGQDQDQEQDKYQYGDQEQNHRDKNGTLTKSNSNHSGSSQHEKQRKESVTSMEMYEEEDDENIYGMSPMTAPAQQQRPPATATVAAAAMRSNFTPKSRMKIMKTIEIDIENPTEGERLSTIKRGQKEYRESTAAISRGSRDHEAGGGGGGGKKQHQQQQQSHEMSARNQATNGNGVQKKSKMEGGAKNGHQSTAQKQKQGQHQQQQTHHQHQMRPNPMDLLHSTEDEGESDDNGTLKMSDVNNFFDDLPHDSSAAGLVMKTVKRKDILKQYYTSEDEESDADEDDAELEIKSTSSDPYDCIVINDHLVRKDDKQRRMQVHHQHNSSYQEHQLEFQTFRATTATATASTPQTKKSKTANGNGNGNGQSNGCVKAQSQKQSAEHDRSYGSSSNNTLTRNGGGGNSAMSTPTATILPRTRLMKSSNTTSMTLERTQHKRESGGGGGSSDKERHFSKTYGPWYDFWDPQDQQQQHHTLISQKSANNSKMK